jgi:hypothetical protein
VTAITAGDQRGRRGWRLLLQLAVAVVSVRGLAWLLAAQPHQLGRAVPGAGQRGQRDDRRELRRQAEVDIAADQRQQPLEDQPAEHGSELWVPKTCASWPDTLLTAGCSAPRPGRARPVLARQSVG